MPLRSQAALWIASRRSLLLVWILVATIIATPLARWHPLIGTAIDALALGVILLGSGYFGNIRIIRNVASPLAALWALTRVIDTIAEMRHLDLQLAPIVGLSLSCAILWALLDRFDRAPRVTSAIIAEAFISYLVIAIAFAQLYRVADYLLPNAFSPPISDLDVGGLLYFSMITLSGVGYGDIVPTNQFVRIVAGLESISGIFYIAVVVARLVAGYPSQARDHHPHPVAPPCDR
jgi:Ion channel